MAKKNSTFETIFNEMMKNISFMQTKIEKGELNEFQISLYKNCLQSATVSAMQPISMTND